MTTAKSYDKLNRLAGMISTPSGGGQLPFSYGASYNEANQRTQTTLNDESYWVYDYDTLGQISSAKKHFADGAFVPGQQFTYSYDHIGNRSTTYAGGDQNGSLFGDVYSYYVDSFLNQYTTRYRPQSVHVMGTADPDETVYVNGAQAAYRNDEYFWKKVPANTMSSTWLEIEVATSGGDTNVGHVFLPSRPEYFTYDLDGNMVSSSRWNYTWDAENRLTSMTDKTTSTNVGPKRIVFEYDYQGRRIAKKVWNNTAGTGTPATYLKYLYDGWNLIAELNGNSTNNALVRSYTWGPDLSGTAQGAGGVGGLLMVNAGSGGVHFPAYDLNGNVMGLINATNGIISAKYEYGPFGEVFCSVGDMAKVNPFQFSTKYTDNETDFVYYGYRYYSPALGRWMSRDPIEERGGLNLYGFVNNDPVNKWDRLGLQGIMLPFSGRMPDEKNAWDVGFEWLFGYGPQKNYFGNNNHYTKELRKHHHIKEAKNIIKDYLTFLCMFCENSDYEGIYNYRLGKYSKKARVALMLRDIASVGNDLNPINKIPDTIKIPFLGEFKLPYNMFNSDISFLGSYDLDYSVDNISCRKSTAHVKFHALNKTSLESLFRSPITGYEAGSNNSIVTKLEWLRSLGFAVDKYQDFRWDEEIKFKGNPCCIYN